jgi:hypothetical protein
MSRLVWLGLFLLAWNVQAETEIFPVRHRLPEEIVKALAPVLARGERLVAVPDGIWVQAERKRLPEIAALIASLDQPSRRLRITVLMSDRFSLEELNASADLEVGEEGRGRVKVYETRAHKSTGLEQSLETLEGQPAFIAVGQELPTPVIHLYGPQVLGGIEYLPATSGFQVTAKLIGCRVRLELAPWSRHPAGGELSVHAAATTLEAPLGRWVELGAAGGDEELANTELLAHRYTSGERGLRLFVRVDAAEGCEGER